MSTPENVQVTEFDAMQIVEEELLGPASLPARIRRGESLDHEGLERLRAALEFLDNEWRYHSSVPKVVARALVDVKTMMASGTALSEHDRDDIEDAVEEIVALGYSAFSVPSAQLTATTFSERLAYARTIFRFVARREVAKLPPGALAFDVSSRAKPPLVKLSPFYPHGGIPVPGMPGTYSDSVEGVWQGLKVMSGEIDPAYFTGKGRKRRGRPEGHRHGERLVGYVEARQTIYIPAYAYAWRECVGTDVRRRLFEPAARGVTQYFFDFEHNGDPSDPSAPLAHSSVLVDLLAREFAMAMDVGATPTPSGAQSDR